MSQARTIQFKKISAILDWYEENENYIGWTVACGKDPFSKYQDEDKSAGAEKLKHTLENLYREGTAAIYTLRISEDDDNTLTANFRLHDHSELYTPGVVGGAPMNEMLSLMRAQEKAIEKLNERLDNLENDDEEEGEGEDNQLGAIGNLLANPFVQGFLAKVFDAQIPQQNGRPQTLSGVNDTGTQQEKIDKAINVLKKHDDKLGDHLLKLASIAESNPAKFKSLLSMLMFT